MGMFGFILDKIDFIGKIMRVKEGMYIMNK